MRNSFHRQLYRIVCLAPLAYSIVVRRYPPERAASSSASWRDGGALALYVSISLYTERDPLVLAIYALQPAKVVTGDVSVSALPGRAARREIPRGRGVRQRDDDRFAQIGAVQGARCEVLRTEQRLLGGGLPGYLFDSYESPLPPSMVPLIAA